eukprot:SAG22_NODE_8088_length_684_cov_1.447863_2_plen_28_part_01
MEGWDAEKAAGLAKWSAETCAGYLAQFE